MNKDSNWQTVFRAVMEAINEDERNGYLNKEQAKRIRKKARALFRKYKGEGR